MMLSRLSPSGRDRRRLLQALAAGAIAGGTSAAAAPSPESLAGQLGVTTGSFVRHLSPEPQPGKLRLLDLPAIMRQRLEMRVIDLMTATLPSLEPDYLEQLRAAAERAGCWLTNLKMNQPGLELGSDDRQVQQHAIAEYQRTIIAAERLGVRWVRPLPGPRRPDLRTLAAGYRALIDFAAPRGISLLVENYGWLASDPHAIPEILDLVGPGLAAQPDTGNWASNEVRYAGLARAFPRAASCDFKVRALGTDGSHDAYDLARCFQIGWQAGFRGPWCFEHFADNLETLLENLVRLRDRLRGWMTPGQ